MEVHPGYKQTGLYPHAKVMVDADKTTVYNAYCIEVDLATDTNRYYVIQALQVRGSHGALVFGTAMFSSPCHWITRLLGFSQHTCEPIACISGVPFLTGGAICYVAIRAGTKSFAIGGTVRVSRHSFALDDAIGSHACSLEVSKSVWPMPFLSVVHSSYRLAL
jgi:hypothetical protein